MAEITVEHLRSLIDRYLSDTAIPQTQCGKFIIAHMDNAPEELQKKRAEVFDPLDFFSPGCSHCAPYLEEGGVILWEGVELAACRLVGTTALDGMALTGSASFRYEEKIKASLG